MKYKLTQQQIKDYYIDLFNNSPKYNNGDVELGENFDSYNDNDFVVNVFEYITKQNKESGESIESLFNSFLNFLGDDLLDTRFYDFSKHYGDKPHKLRDCLEGMYEITYE